MWMTVSLEDDWTGVILSCTVFSFLIGFLDFNCWVTVIGQHILEDHLSETMIMNVLLLAPDTASAFRHQLRSFSIVVPRCLFTAGVWHLFNKFTTTIRLLIFDADWLFFIFNSFYVLVPELYSAYLWGLKYPYSKDINLKMDRMVHVFPRFFINSHICNPCF